MPKTYKTSKNKGSSGLAPAAGPSRPKSKKAPSRLAPILYSSFHPLALDLPCPVPIAGSSTSAAHYIYVRPHQPKTPAAATDADADQPEGAGRTMFAINLPVDMGVRDLRAVFSRWGVVESVEIGIGASGDVLEDAVRGLPVSDDESDEEDEADEAADEAEARPEPKFIGTGERALPRSKRPRRRPQTLPSSVPDVTPLPSLDPRETPLGLSGQTTAHVVFLDAVSVSRCMTHAAPIALPDYPSEPVGLDYYAARHARATPDLRVVKDHADTAMDRYDHLHALLLASRARKAGAGALVDEDGFTVVVRGGRYGRTAGRGDALGVAVARRATAPVDAKKKGRGAGELVDFYRFQQVDRKRKELADMRAKFEQDKQKVEELKRAKRFKPY
ncbi:hypothetical protein Q5752_005229 [Cryptotrichosporon argae]